MSIPSAPDEFDDADPPKGILADAAKSQPDSLGFRPRRPRSAVPYLPAVGVIRGRCVSVQIATTATTVTGITTIHGHPRPINTPAAAIASRITITSTTVRKKQFIAMSRSLTRSGSVRHVPKVMVAWRCPTDMDICHGSS